MADYYRDTITGNVYQPVDDEHRAYFEKWARFVSVDNLDELAATSAPDSATVSGSARGKKAAAPVR
ncbi:hypothetical protein [Nocardia terpenica]|uniref:Uncharacterized protein n=1 Tax=Nocardia terpenica TaxID=455432 RepID=A0A164H1Z6_9NOCA|nr:hypothetical protein [Nocardia terpenica]KZM68134.1 hypothetical protein AWN90_09335 [Nocardia terpenica]NQE89008.1 hypothetical protein [Nocardia terpenica]